MVPECLWRKVLLPTQGWGQVFFDEAINPNPKGWVVHCMFLGKIEKNISLDTI